MLTSGPDGDPGAFAYSDLGRICSQVCWPRRGCARPDTHLLTDARDSEPVGSFAVCYQVSDTTVHDRRIRRTALSHALLSYVFSVPAIVAGPVNLIAGLTH